MAEIKGTRQPMRMHFYKKPGDKFPRTWAHCDKAKASEFRPECIIVEKVVTRTLPSVIFLLE